MTVFEKIFAWSKEIPPWQSDALRRLLLQHELLDEDYADLAALAKQCRQIPDEKERIPQPLSKEDVPVSGATDTPVILRSLGNLKHVNALVDSQDLRFAECGVTVIYGDNGSGKSGYARVLKRACRARDDEPVLPNAALPKTQQGKPEAVLTVSIGTNVKAEHWVDGQPSPESLSVLSVFDSHCARVYLDEESDIAFKPYGLDLVEDLGKVCLRVRNDIQRENESLKVDLNIFDDLKGSTKVGELISTLSDKTDPLVVNAKASISEEERKRIDELEAILKEGSPLEKAKTLRATANRINRLAEACETRVQEFADTVVARFRGVDEALVAAQRASDLLVKSLKEDRGMLPGTGDAAWRNLLIAAQKYSDEAYPGHPFPHTDSGAKCVLCQQDLTEGKDRYRKFGDFMLNAAEEELRKATANMKVTEREIQRLNLTLPVDDELLADIRTTDQSLADLCHTFQQSLVRRHESVVRAFSDHTWQAVEPLADSPASALTLQSQGLLKSAESLESSADKVVRDKLVQEQLEFRAREQLGRRKEALLQTIERLRYKNKLAGCAADIDTTAISRKAKALTQESVSEALGTALNQEFAGMGIDYLKVTFDTRVEYGKTLQKLRLNFPGSTDISNILSEGEQRSLAIASFLAEISLAPGSSGLIFDDPVSSLDHLRREKVAARLVGEGVKRQIVIFTHDLFFLGLLNSEAARQQVPILCQSVLKLGQQTGVLSPDLPFEGQSTKQRIGSLKQLAQQAVAATRAGEHAVVEAIVKSGYEKLREAWERAVEEVLLQGVVERFGREIHTHQLSGVVVEENDYLEVNGAMARCSMFTHDRPRAGGTTVLDPVEFQTDVLALEAFRNRIVTRADEAKTGRKAKITPPKAVTVKQGGT